MYCKKQIEVHTLHVPEGNVLWLAGVQHYNEIKGISICEFLPPHLAIYVDVPADEVQKKLKQSGKVARCTVIMWQYFILTH